MANVLGELFTDIASAIREKTGESSDVKMKPAEFADKILSIEGGGGGTLPAGLYWETMPINAPVKYWQFWLQYKGDIYAFYYPYASTGGEVTISKYDGSAWTTVVSKAKSYINLYHQWAIEFDGVIHYLGGYSKHHYTFDGTNFVALSDMPVTVDYSRPFILNAQLAVCDYNSSTVYVWDKATDTWSAAAISIPTFSYPFNVGTDVYYVKDTKLYKLQDGSFSKFGSLSTSPYAYFTVHNGKLYYYNSTGLYEHDFETNTSRTLGRVPKYAQRTNLWVYNDQLCYTFGGTDMGYTSVIMRLVE